MDGFLILSIIPKRVDKYLDEIDDKCIQNK